MIHCSRSSVLAAFTLVELMVVVILLGILATIVTVRLLGASDAARLSAARSEIETRLRMARQFTRSQHRAAILCLRPAGGEVRTQFDMAGGGWKKVADRFDAFELNGQRVRGPAEGISMRVSRSGA